MKKEKNKSKHFGKTEVFLKKTKGVFAKNPWERLCDPDRPAVEIAYPVCHHLFHFFLLVLFFYQVAYVVF